MVDYDDESGVYLGPGHAFDDEDLDYLNNDVVEVQETRLHQAIPLVVDSASGIYLGFDEALTDDEEVNDEDGKTRNIKDHLKEGDVHIKPATEDLETLENPQKTPSIARPLSMRTLLLSKQSSKYKVTGGTEKEGNICFRFLRKFWRKRDACH